MKKCRVCGLEKPIERFVKNGFKNGVRQYTTQCKECKAAGSREWYHRTGYSTTAPPKGRRAIAEAKLARAAAGSARKKVLQCGPCRVCGVSFVNERKAGVRRRASCGSEHCRAVVIRDCRRESSRRRRALERGAFVEAVDTFALGDECGWLCGICGGPVDPDVRMPDQDCVSLDHIVPLSAGGLHERANCQIAHFRCNRLKGNSV